MKLGVMQPYFLPYIGYFQLINAVDKFVLLDDVNYINRGWINRNRIAINQQPHWLTIPLEKASQNRLINEISLHRDSLWREKLCLTVKTNYSKAPFFKMVYPIFENILKFPAVDLLAFLHHSLEEILSYLKITTVIVPTSVVYLKNDLKGQYRILDICQKEEANIYLNPPGGKELYERELFRAAGIDLYFLEPDLRGMNLVSGVNQGPVLSILDLMMLNHPDLIRQNLESYQLV